MRSIEMSLRADRWRAYKRGYKAGLALDGFAYFRARGRLQYVESMTSLRDGWEAGETRRAEVDALEGERRSPGVSARAPVRRKARAFWSSMLRLVGLPYYNPMWRNARARG